MSVYKQVGRFTVEMGGEGLLMQSSGYAAKLSYVDGWNTDCETRDIHMSVEDMRDLHYALGRAIDEADLSLRNRRV
jgi:hypothetical protein